MAGIVFFNTKGLDRTVEFYRARPGMTLWLDQGGCVILRHENLLLGFCQGEQADTEGIITLFYQTREDVDAMYQQLKEHATCTPRINEAYQIYQFFAEDPEHRVLEFQVFLHPIPEIA